MKVTGEQMVDVAHLRQYTLGDAALEREVLHMFLEQCDLHMKRLRQAQTLEGWKESCHSLKGAASGVGAFQLSAYAARLESLAPLPEENERATLLDSLQKHVDSTGHAIISHLDKNGATASL